MATPTDPTLYFQSADRKSQCAIVTSDLLHRMIWGVTTHRNFPAKGVEVVTPADPLEWLEAQLAERVGAENAAYRISMARADMAYAEDRMAA
jgi:hypothetical protein